MLVTVMECVLLIGSAGRNLPAIALGILIRLFSDVIVVGRTAIVACP